MTIQANFPNVQPSLLLDFANAKQLPPQVTFTRATTATYYDGSTTALAEQNLITYSQEFSNWQQERTTTTANSTTAPDGTTTADTIAASGAANNHSVYHPNEITLANGFTYTYSVYAKKNGSDFVQLTWYQNGFSNAYVNFDLNAGTIGTTSGCTATITSVGSGWYRCTMTATCNVSSAGRFYVSLVTSSTSAQFEQFAATTQSIYAWGAQAEIRTTATAYTATTTQPITNYIPVLLTAGGGQPRFDHNPTTSESLGLLIEESRTNALTYSQDFSNGAWTKTAATITADTVVAPDGTLTGDKLVCDSATTDTEKFINRSIYSYVGQTVNGSVYLKKGEYTWAQVNLFNGASYRNRVWVNLDTGAIGTNLSGIPATITAVGNGWYRVTLTATIQSSGSAFITVALADADADLYTNIGNQYSGTFVWGAQLETGVSFATSYIPTTSAAATRAPDLATMTGNNFTSWFNAGEGTVVYELDTARPGSNTFSFNFDNGTASSSANVLFSSAGLGSNLYVTSGNSNQVNINAGVTPVAGTFFKTALFYEVNNFAVSVNGNAAVTDTTGVLPYGLARLVLGTAYDLASSNYIDGHIKKFAYYPQAVTAAQLAALSS